MENVSSALTRTPTLRVLDAHRRAAVPDPRRPSDRGPVRVVLCHPAVLAGRATAAALGHAPEIAEVVVVATATDLVRTSAPRADVALVSESLGQELPELLQALAFRGVALPVVIMTTNSAADVAAQYLEWGAAGSVDLGGPLATVVEAVLLASAGTPVVDPRRRADVTRCLADRAAQREHARRLLHGLSHRERQVLEYLAGGTGVADIAQNLHLSPHTIRACIRTLGPKLDVAGQLQLASVARALTLVAQAPFPSRYLQQVRAEGAGMMPLIS